ncbi:hypothetical protein IT072_19700 [Leifsonia sp. ZF2019]|uniref:hypothetical protein n=1 Tax=Leifsonia sp. ZF2019 TaxID=2781978 RepID=UPI001CC0C8EC|nr:hypothetical protein [Leifsonia sp. ZF2019]UAJ79382.1 hypothetical protein IT072_19700 [Leifsonia sp. ZF2019]
MSTTTHDEYIAVPSLRQGQLISLIRWTKDADEWTYTTLLAEYLHRDDTSWHVVLDGEPTRISRDEWAIFN